MYKLHLMIAAYKSSIFKLCETTADLFVPFVNYNLPTVFLVWQCLS